ncbi:hypothetical protein [Nocardia sp. NPDC057440]|uniref:hypothetical protein n=1 Tax=Nocardia sp. NPDC057440 TaxID=3346134 RepID=UPI00366B15AF
MGFYDCRCMVTGIGLDGIGATAVLIRRNGDVYQPISLGIAGNYDRSGAVDGVTEDLGTDVLLRYFLDRLSDGRLVLDLGATEFDRESPPADIDELLWCFERNCLDIDDEPAAAAIFDGSPILLALIAQPIWDGVTAAAIADRFENAFPDSPTAWDIYRDHPSELSVPAGQLRAINDLLAARGMAWASPAHNAQRYPTDYGGQHDSEDLRRFLDEARRDYHDLPIVLSAIESYEKKIRDLLIDD